MGGLLSANIRVRPGKGKANVRPDMGKDCSVVMYHGMGSMGYENVSFTEEENNEVWRGQRSKWVNPEEELRDGRKQCWCVRGWTRKHELT